MYQQVSDAGAEFKHWNPRGDLVATSSSTGTYAPATITDAFGDTVAGVRPDLRLEQRKGGWHVGYN